MSQMPGLTKIFWRDIPAQVIGQQGRRRHKCLLSPRFAAAIDRAAMRAGRGSSEAYLEDWRRESQACEGNIEQAVTDEVARQELLFLPDLLETIVKASGLRKQTPPES